MDKMQMYELEPLVSNIHKRNKENWELTRILAYIIALVNSTKKLLLTDIIKFEWDKVEAANTSISDSDVLRLREEAKRYINNK